MSFTVIVPFDENGTAIDDCAHIQNSWRGGMAIWRIMEKKYLPPYYPEYAQERTPEEFEKKWGRPPIRILGCDDEAWKELWDTVYDKEIPFEDRIVMATTLDDVIVLRKDIPRLIEAFRKFEGETSLPEQADILEEFLKDESISAVAWNQTSINVDKWTSYYPKDIDESEDLDEDDSCVLYNYNEYEDHWFLFDEITE